MTFLGRPQSQNRDGIVANHVKTFPIDKVSIYTGDRYKLFGTPETVPISSGSSQRTDAGLSSGAAHPAIVRLTYDLDGTRNPGGILRATGLARRRRRARVHAREVDSCHLGEREGGGSEDSESLEVELHF